MPAKPNKNKWDDIKMLIAAASLTGTLALWNYFAAIGYDSEPIPTLEPFTESIPTEPITIPVVQPTPTAIEGKVLLGGAAPQDRVIVQSSGGGSKPVTQTRSS